MSFVYVYTKWQGPRINLNINRIYSKNSKNLIYIYALMVWYFHNDSRASKNIYFSCWSKSILNYYCVIINTIKTYYNNNERNINACRYIRPLMTLFTNALNLWKRVKKYYVDVFYTSRQGSCNLYYVMMRTVSLLFNNNILWS